MPTTRPHHPGSTAAAILVLALGFGALGIALAVGKAVLWDDLPYREPSRLVEMNGVYEEKGEVQPWAIGHLDFTDWRQKNRSFDSMSVFTDTGSVAFNLRSGRDLVRVDGELVSHSYFETLGIQPLLGRFFTAEEDREPFVHPVVVLSHDLWQSRFAGDKDIVGRTVSLSGKDWRVIGVAPEGIRGLTDKAELWIPSSMVPGPEYVEVRRMRWLRAVGRLKPGVTLEQARGDMRHVTAALEKQYPDQNRGIGVELQPLREFVYPSGLARELRLVLIAAAVLLLFAFLDAAALLRRGVQEGSPQAPGALLASVTGAVLGLVLAGWAIHALLPTSGLAIPAFARLAPDLKLGAELLALAVLGGLSIPGLARLGRPALILSSVVQAVLALGLLLIAGQRYQRFHQAVGTDLGFKPEGLLTMRLDLTAPLYADDAEVARLAGEYLRRLTGLPEVQSVALTGPTMATDDWVGAFATAEDHDNPQSDDGTYKVLTHGVSPDYFRVMGVPLVQGRAFTSQDTAGFHVILSQAMAKEIWPGKNALGLRLKFSARKVQPRPWLTVIGVVADTRYQGFFKDERPAPDFYLSVLQQPVRLPMILNLLARPRAGVSMASLEAALRRGILAVTPDVPPYDVAPMQERLDRQARPEKLRLRVAGFFGLAMAGLAVIAAVTAVAAVAAGRAGR